MPTYTYACLECGDGFDVMKPMSESDTPEMCPGCEGETQKVVNWEGNAILKGDGWPSKNNRIKGQMARKNRILKAKEDQFKRDGGIPTLVPNVDGERTGSWSDAKKLAKSKGKNTAGYDKMISSEKASSTR